MERLVEEESTADINAEITANEANKRQSLSESGKKLVSLIVKIIINATLKECHEESDKIPEV
ncbi:hypothetical protein SAMN04488511_1163 [Pedobacter suwonensis]|uniref:Uncharacterized protein n=1 Tax=Pedobacter suwonensis TaxID=332999 RepID=A0A1I0TXN5_9SPHI|nr:hypothetical protein [Pedobacter suwonensis]SFA56437.1 hypothetical protein SAMN04488511_1163 [Pedobacter suwonensis]